MSAHRDIPSPHPGRGHHDVRPAFALAVVAVGLLGAVLTGNGLATPPTVVSASPEPHALLTGTHENGDPALQDLRYSPGSVNVLGGSKNVTFTVTARDTGGPGPASGITYGFVSLSSPDFTRSAYTTLERRSAGTWVGTVAIPRWTHGGVWNVNTLGLGDGDDNYEHWSGSELADLGYPTTLTVGAHPDDTAPELTHVTVSPRPAYSRTAARTVTVTARAIDDRSGIASVIASASKPGTRHRSFTTLTKVRGTASTYRGSLVIPRREAAGGWRIDFVRLDDIIGNTTIASHAQLRAAGLPRAFRVARTATVAASRTPAPPAGP
ncbi:MAG: hypothetical protein ACXW1M_09835 [Acidimicrobiia bacterium]